MVNISAAPPPCAAVRFDVLDGLRGICAVMLVIYHFRSNGYISSVPLVQHGWMFVDYFFVLSGFVIAHSYGSRLAGGEISIARFMGLRLGRLYPLHLFMLACFVALELLLVIGGDTIAQFVSREPFSSTRGVEPLVQALLLTQSFGIGTARGWNGPAWSIAAEIWTYLLFACVFVFARGKTVLVSLALAAAAALALLSYAGDMLITFEGGILRAIFGFGLGAAAYHLFRRRPLAGGSLQELGVLAITIAFVSLATGAVTFLAPLVFAGMIVVLASQNGVVSGALRARPFQFLGMTSYSIYMIHVFVQGRLGEVLQITKAVDISVDAQGRTLLEAPPLVSDAVTLVMLALVVGGAYVTYRLVEVPGQRLSRRLLEADRAPVTVSQPTD